MNKVAKKAPTAYCIELSNLNSRDKLEQIFYRSGKVLDVNPVSDVRFMRYENVKEAVKALRKRQLHIRARQNKRIKLELDGEIVTKPGFHSDSEDADVSDIDTSVDGVTLSDDESPDTSPTDIPETTSTNFRYFNAEALRDERLSSGYKAASPDPLGRKKKELVELIVGNIHPDYEPVYFMHLFNKYEPIKVSEIDIVAGRRYCRVYFKSNEVAAEVERSFDRHELSGMNLIVIRRRILMITAMNNRIRRYMQ